MVGESEPVLFGRCVSDRPFCMRRIDEDVVDRIEREVPVESEADALARRPYERLIARIRRLADEDDGGMADGWEDRAFGRWLRERDDR